MKNSDYTTRSGDGELIGREPRDVGRKALAALGGPQGTTKAIRAKCLDCCCGSAPEVRKCTAVRCALWPFRMGRNPFHSRARENDADRPALRAA